MNVKEELLERICRDTSFERRAVLNRLTTLEYLGVDLEELRSLDSFEIWRLSS